jgi:hypothetical protein
MSLLISQTHEHGNRSITNLLVSIRGSSQAEMQKGGVRRRLLLDAIEQDTREW